MRMAARSVWPRWTISWKNWWVTLTMSTTTLPPRERHDGDIPSRRRERATRAAARRPHRRAQGRSGASRLDGRGRAARFGPAAWRAPSPGGKGPAYRADGSAWGGQEHVGRRAREAAANAGTYRGRGRGRSHVAILRRGPPR